jgi:hypothetical protein
MMTPKTLYMFVAGLVLAILLVGKSALAAGAFTLKTADVQENSGSWHIKVRIDLPRPPSMMHTPMRFTFSKEVVDERAIMTKGADPVHHRQVLDTPTKQIVGMDVDFANATGAVFKSTVFEFDLERKDGYFEAGEYQVSLSGPDGDVGGSQKLLLRGDNPPVYRGAMVFTDDKKATTPKKKNGPDMQNVSSGVEKTEVAQNDNGSSGPAATEVTATADTTGMIPASAGNTTADEESVKQHPSGCGCVVAGVQGETFGGAAAGLLALGALVLVGGRRRATRK